MGGNGGAEQRVRAAMLTAPEGHIVFESYNDWLIDQREKRRKKGVWNLKNVPKHFMIGHPHVEMIMGMRAWRKWKECFSVKRQYTGRSVL